MLQVKAEGVHNGQQRTSVVLCYHDAPPRGVMDTEFLLPETQRELILYELPRKPCSSPPWPLAYQEALVYRINTHLETLGAAEGRSNVVNVENDTFVNEAGYGVAKDVIMSSDDVDDSNEEEQRENRPGTSGKLTLDISNSSQPQGTYEVSRKWQQVPMLPLSCSRLSFETQGNELIARCRYAHVYIFLFRCMQLKLTGDQVSFSPFCLRFLMSNHIHVLAIPHFFKSMLL
jgi:hypothetical protein